MKTLENGIKTCKQCGKSYTREDVLKGKNATKKHSTAIFTRSALCSTCASKIEDPIATTCDIFA